jgi:putative ABC transport system substrate-binding protein
LIYAGDNGAAAAAKAAKTTIPIVFRVGDDPVALGLVASLNRPGGNITGVTFLSTTTVALNVQMLHEAVPRATVVGVLVNPTNPNEKANMRAATDAAQKLGLQLHILKASTDHEIEAAFAELAHRPLEPLVIFGDTFFNNRMEQLALLAFRHSIPATFNTRQFPDAGGLMSYGASNIDADRAAGVYAGRILKGTLPGDLPVMQPTKFELVINLKAAKAFGLEISSTLLARADEVIE